MFVIKTNLPLIKNKNTISGPLIAMKPPSLKGLCKHDNK